MLRAECWRLILAAPPACAAHHAVRRHRARPATLLPELAESPPDPAFRLPPAPIPATRAASRRPARGALRAAHHPDTRTGSHSKSHAKTAMVLACQRPECGFARRQFR